MKDGWVGGKMDKWRDGYWRSWTELDLTFLFEECVPVQSLVQTERRRRADSSYSWLHYSTHQGLIENGGGETEGKGQEIFLKMIYKYSSAPYR